MCLLIFEKNFRIIFPKYAASFCKLFATKQNFLQKFERQMRESKLTMFI